MYFVAYSSSLFDRLQNLAVHSLSNFSQLYVCVRHSTVMLILYSLYLAGYMYDTHSLEGRFFDSLLLFHHL